jgi:ubiquinone/menaquinone biosynthesis C-methylase UbiE
VVSNLIYALVIVGQTGQDTLIAHFPNREICMAEAQRVIEQGPSAYCFPTNQITQADIQRQFDSMMVLMRRFRGSMESQ